MSPMWGHLPLAGDARAKSRRRRQASPMSPIWSRNSTFPSARWYVSADDASLPSRTASVIASDRLSSCWPVSLTCLASNSSTRVRPSLAPEKDRRRDPFDDVADVAAGNRPVVERGQRRPDRAAAVVPEHHDQRHAQDGDGVLDGSEHRAVDHVARRANHEHVTQPLVEDDLRGDPAVRASEHHGRRLLRTRRGSRGVRCSGWGALGSPATKRSLPSLSAFQAVNGLVFGMIVIVPEPVSTDRSE